MAISPESAETSPASRALAGEHTWYHTIDLAPGVSTPGWVDLRRSVAKVLPDALSGRALDVGAFDGFWSFEMEKRGAEVVAIDVDELAAAEWPPLNRPRLEAQVEAWGLELGRGFRLAADALGSKVQRVVCDVYELEPDRIGGPVDFAFIGSLLLHLRDPVRALERVRATLRPGGELRLMEPVSLGLTLRSPRRPVARFQPTETSFNWWYPNVAALRAWLLAAGFEAPQRLAFMRPPSEPRMRQSYAAFSARAPSAGR